MPSRHIASFLSSTLCCDRWKDQSDGCLAVRRGCIGDIFTNTLWLERDINGRATIRRHSKRGAGCLSLKRRSFKCLTPGRRSSTYSGSYCASSMQSGYGDRPAGSLPSKLFIWYRVNRSHELRMEKRLSSITERSCTLFSRIESFPRNCAER